MSLQRNLKLFPLYQMLTVEGICHGLYLLFLVQVKGLSALTVAILMAAGDFLLMFLDVPTGIIADRLGRRLSMLLGSSIQILGLSLMWLGQSYFCLGMAFLTIALGDAFRSGADQALLFETCQALGCIDQFRSRLAQSHTLTLCFLVVEVLLGGWLAENWGYDFAWASEVALAMVGLIVALLMIEAPAAIEPLPLEVDDEEESSGFPPLATLLNWRSVLWYLLIPGVIITTLNSTLGIVAQTLLAVNLGPKWIAWLVAGLQFMEALGALLALSWPFRGPDRGLASIALFSLAAVSMMGIVPSSLFLVLALLSFGDGLAQPILGAALQEHAKDGERAQTASMASATKMLGITIWSPLATILYSWFHLTGMVTIMVSVLGLIWWLLVRKSTST